MIENDSGRRRTAGHPSTPLLEGVSGSKRSKVRSLNWRRASNTEESDGSVVMTPNQIEVEKARLIPRRTVASGLHAVRFAAEVVVAPGEYRKYAWLCAQIKDLLHEVSGVITVANKKGGAGKTPTITEIAAMASMIGRSAVIVDSNENGGSTASRLGVRRDRVLQLPEFIERMDEFQTFEALKPSLGMHRESGLWVIASPEFDKPSKQIRQGKMEEALAKLVKMFGVVFVDQGNALNGYNNITASRFACFCGGMILSGLEADKKQVSELEERDGEDPDESIDEIFNSIENFRADPQIGDLIDGSRIAILGAKPWKRDSYLEKIDWPGNQVVLIPHDRGMEPRAFGVVRTSRRHLATRLAQAELLYSVLLNMKQTRECNNSGETHPKGV